MYINNIVTVYLGVYNRKYVRLLILSLYQGATSLIILYKGVENTFF